MEGYEKLQQSLLYEKEGLSVGPGLYRLDKAQRNNTIAYPWAPTVRIQNFGALITENLDRMDVESDLRNITRKLSNDPQEKYIPDENSKMKPDVNVYNNVKDGFFHTENSRLNEPAFELKGLTKNRWINLKKNPQEHVIEPFLREGENTYLDLLDNYKDCPVYLKK